MKSFKPRHGGGGEPPAAGGRNAEADFHGEKRSNETHASTTILMPGSIARDRARRPGCASSAMA